MADNLRAQNEKVFNQLMKGDLVEFPRKDYTHWAVYVGDENVVHFTGNIKDTIGLGTFFGERNKQATVLKGIFYLLANESKAIINNHNDAKLEHKNVGDIVRVAMAMVGEHIGYNLIWHNCEHFANFCRYSFEKKDQSDWAISLATHIGCAGIKPLPVIKLAEKVAVLAYVLWPFT